MATVELVVYGSDIYQHLSDGTIKQYDRDDKSDPWKVIGKSPNLAQIVAGVNVYQRLKTGEVLGLGDDDEWESIDPASKLTANILASGENLFKTLKDGTIYRYNGDDWLSVCGETDTTSVVADDSLLYRLSQRDEEIYKWDGTRWDSYQGCYRTAEWVAAGGKGDLYRRGDDGTIYWHPAGPGSYWNVLRGSDGSNIQIAAGKGGVVLRRKNGEIWKLAEGTSWNRISDDANNDDVQVADSIYRRTVANEIYEYAKGRWHKLQ